MFPARAAYIICQAAPQEYRSALSHLPPKAYSTSYRSLCAVDPNMRTLAASVDGRLKSIISRVAVVKNNTDSPKLNADRLEYFTQLNSELSDRIEEHKRGRRHDILDKVHRKQAQMDRVFQEVLNGLKDGNGIWTLEQGELRVREISDAILAILHGGPRERSGTGARILSLCGDGVLVLSQLLIIRELMVKVGRLEDLGHATLPCKYFDLIVGTGTGALAAIFLGRLEMTAQEAISAFCRITRETAATTSSVDPEKLTDHMQNIVQDHLGTPFAPMRHASGCRTLVFAATHSLVDAPPVPFRSYDTDTALASMFSVVQVATAVCAPPERPPRLGSPPVSYTNAARFLYNDPTELALEETEHLWTSSYPNLVLCIGPGTRTVVNASGGKPKQDAAYKNLAAGSRDTVHESVYKRSRGKFIYHRLQVNRGLEHIGKDHWSMNETVMKTITDITHGYLRFKETEDVMLTFARALCDDELHENISGKISRIDHEPFNQSFVGREDGLASEHHELVLYRHLTNPAPDFSLFSRRDILIVKTIRLQPWSFGNRDSVAVTLHKATQPGNVRTLLVKTYEGKDRGRVRREFLGHLALSRKTWDPVLLQIKGWSELIADIPFQVYHAPDDIDEGFWTWLEHTLQSNPKDVIFGLYDMRESIKALYQFAKGHQISMGYVFDLSVVTVQRYGARPRFSLVYTGHLPDPKSLFDNGSRVLEPFHQYTIPRFLKLFVSKKSSPHDPLYSAAMLTSAFAKQAQDWVDDTRGLESLIKQTYEEVEFPQLGSALFDAGLLGQCYDIVPIPTTLKLGDVGFMEPDGWVVVTNLHAKLLSVTGRIPRWRLSAWGEDVHTDDPGETIEVLGETYRRHEYAWRYEGEAIGVGSQHYFLQYTDIDQSHAWKTLQHEACRIIAEHGLSVAPHQLQLVIDVEHVLLRKIILSGSFPGYTPSTAAIRFFGFQHGDVLRVDGSGAPELNPRIFYSWKPNVTEMDCKTYHGNQEKMGDLTLKQRPWQHICFLQLPEGVACPSYVEELQD